MNISMYLLDHCDCEKIIDNECHCLSNNCKSYRYLLAFSINDIKIKQIRICNEYIRTRVNNYIFEKKAFNTIHSLEIESIYIDILKRNGIYYNYDLYNRIKNTDTMSYIICERPYIFGTIKIIDVIKIIYMSDKYIGWYDNFMCTFNSALINHLNYLLKYKKYNYQHDLANKIIKRLKGNYHLSKNELFEVATLIFNLKINNHESTSKQ